MTAANSVGSSQPAYVDATTLGGGNINASLHAKHVVTQINLQVYSCKIF